ncbi:uncharacterized protein LOC110689827 [Chenopodium quinoa]|uniref:uncharacterized protein LOC110689827 n=1 Tax=Chenopodium quinoa TaxID=63459 RepID=UPI000B77B6AC|nr:uncharacterized protein LOC110689827 [Chenopodium quinoa]XP_021722346.1 uncharacterized protein LOC110689827 [Chenopodium quinoa]XP_021722347.1 uncharacterized protein LOC110689827 [Chenopodium quinoa]XP_021722348.1 uncharacterized protein LOC110689827 [Chenopodium quinoa]
MVYILQGPNVICRVDMFYLRVIKSLDKSRKEEVKLMGFGGLLELKLNYLPRQLCYWIMSRIQSCGSIEFGDEQVMMLAPIQLQCILGLPMEEKVVPLKVDRDDRVMVKKLDGIIRDYRAGGKNGDQLSLVKAIGVVTKGLDKDGNELPLANDAEKMQFRNAFLIVVLGALLCPTTKWGLLAKKLTPAITVARHSAKYDWCTMVYNWLIDCVKVFADKFDENGFAAGCGGCSLFVLVFYLDHLHRPPVRWGVLPRIKVWTAVEVTRATKEDKRRTSDDYGKLMCAPVAYGEEDHPYAVRDSSRTLVQKVAAEVVNLLKPQLQSMVSEAVRNEVQSPIKTIIPLRRRTILISDLTRMKSSDLIRRVRMELMISYLLTRRVRMELMISDLLTRRVRRDLRRVLTMTRMKRDLGRILLKTWMMSPRRRLLKTGMMSPRRRLLKTGMMNTRRILQSREVPKVPSRKLPRMECLVMNKLQVEMMY